MPSRRVQDNVHEVSCVIPVYQGGQHLERLVAELDLLSEPTISPGGSNFRVSEVILVHDCGSDKSAQLVRGIADLRTSTRVVWLSRNFGQHAATLAGMSSSTGDWISTLDEDGQHDPGFIGRMLDTALREQSALVYALPKSSAPHPWWRNATSHAAKRLAVSMGGLAGAQAYHSYRLMTGEVGRSVAAYAGAGVYLDVALSWVAGQAATCPVDLRPEGDRVSSYNFRRLISHLWSMVLTSGTHGLRMVSLLGLLFAVGGVGMATYVLVSRLADDSLVQGWTSLMVLLLLATGAVLFSLGVIAEYIGVAVNMALGKPPYMIIRDPQDGPLGRRPHDHC